MKIIGITMIKYGLILSLLVNLNHSVAAPLSGLVRQGLHNVMAKNNAASAGLVRLYSSKQNHTDTNVNNSAPSIDRDRYDALSAEKAGLCRELGSMIHILEDCRDKCNILIDNGKCDCVVINTDKCKAITVKISALNKKMQDCMDAAFIDFHPFNWVHYLESKISDLEVTLKTTNDVDKKAHITSAIERLSWSKLHWEKLYKEMENSDILQQK